MSRKKLLAILGSPHPNGTTAAMLEYAVRASEGAGYDVTKIDLYQKNIRFCTGCRACLHTGTCIQQDDMQEITSLLQECHAVILAAPVYWANIPAPTKNLFDRLLGAAMEETNTFPRPRLAGKHYMLLTACNTPFPFSWMFGQSGGALRSMNEFFRTAGMKCMGKFVCTNTSKRKYLPKSLIRKIERCWNVQC